MNSRHDIFIEPIVVYCMQHQEAYPILMQRLAEAFLAEAVKKECELKEQCSQTESGLLRLMFDTQKVNTKKGRQAWQFARNKIMPFIENDKTFNNWYFILTGKTECVPKGFSDNERIHRW
jgi:hypothetical protein